jgi:hypothetical protein
MRSMVGGASPRLRRLWATQAPSVSFADSSPKGGAIAGR